MPINILLKIYMYLPEEVLPYVLETVKKAKKRVSECTIKLSLTQSLRIKLEQCSRCQKQASSVSTQLIIADVSRQKKKKKKKMLGLA